MSSSKTISHIQDLKKAGVSQEDIRAPFLNRVHERNAALNALLDIHEKPLPQPEDYAISSPLNGVPAVLKDNLLLQDHKTTAGSKMLENYIASYDAHVTKKLRHAGVDIIGKGNLDEFAMGASGENSAFGPTRNPHDESRVAGGSSSGSAAAVASGMAVFALGSDTGGSIRCPASYCGIVGVKPTYGRVSRHGLVAMASSLDQIGPLANTVEDAAHVLHAIAGRDPMDATSADIPVPDYAAEMKKDIKGLRVAVPKEFFGPGLDPKTKPLIEAAIKKLESLGAIVSEVSLPMTDYAIATYYIIVPSEVSSNLARFDGIRYGMSQGREKDLQEVYTKTRELGFGEEVRRRIILGTFVLSAGYYDAYYLKAQKVRTLARESFDAIFKDHDIIVGPVTPSIAPKVGEIADPVSMYLADIFTVQANLAGTPALSMPCGTIDVEGKKMPVGFQIMANHFDESTMFRAAYALEQELKI